MLLKLKNHILIGSSYILLLVTSSCGSDEHKTDVAFDKVKEDKFISGDSVVNNVVGIQTPIRSIEVRPTQNADEWLLFKVEIEKKINKNEVKLREMISRSKVNSKQLKRAESLQEENSGLKRLLNEFDTERKNKLEEFKTEMDHQISQVGIDLAEISSSKKN